MIHSVGMVFGAMAKLRPFLRIVVLAVLRSCLERLTTLPSSIEPCVGKLLWRHSSLASFLTCLSCALRHRLFALRETLVSSIIHKSDCMIVASFRWSVRASQDRQSKIARVFLISILTRVSLSFSNALLFWLLRILCLNVVNVGVSFLSLQCLGKYRYPTLSLILTLSFSRRQNCCKISLPCRDVIYVAKFLWW